MAAVVAVAHEEDAELQIDAVDEYYFVSSREEPVCFSTLPLLRGAAAAADDDDVPEGNSNRLLCLRGFAFAGGRSLGVLKMVAAWRLELDGEQPEFFVLLTRADGGGGGWLRLAKPRKLYERTARTVLMTAQALHFLRRNPHGPETALWIHLRQAFGMFGPRPSEHDFRNQTSLSLMRQFAATDPVLSNSEALRAFVERISTEVGGADNNIVDEYFFQVSKDNYYELMCFSTLPLRFSDAAIDVPEDNKALYLLGHTNTGLMLQKKVVAWRLELDCEQPQFFVLAQEDGGCWLRLAMASKIYERTVRSVLMTAQMLHFLRRNPDGLETALWIHLRQVFGNFLPRPSEDDLWNQTSLSLMRQFAATDPVLGNSEALRAFVERISTRVGGADIIGIADKYSFHATDNHELMCFSTLPLWFVAATANVPNGNKALYLKGFTAGGIRLSKEVVAWRLELDGEQPRFLVLVTGYGGGWLCLANACNMYKHRTKTVLMTSQMLHFLRRNPDGPQTALWIHLHQVFGKFWSMPSEDDFRNQTSLSLMRRFASMDPVLENSKALRAFAERISTQVGAHSIDIADGEVINEKIFENGNNESDEDLFGSVCAICDDGGELLFCDGPCMRSFHAKKGSGEDSYCDTLGYTEAEVEAMKLFLCKNCEYKQHQCFICGVLEPSDGATAKVFLCNNATCGHFYHPKCVAQQLHPNNINEASELEKKITEGFAFTCPIHRCFHCKGLEDRTFQPLQFAVCRRCPKSYHRKCLPRQISFEEIEEEGIITQAWELSKSFLIYCMDHEIDRNTKAPVRDHIKFPKIEEPMCKKKKRTCGPRIIETRSNFGNL